MLNVGAGEIIFILIAALLILGPKRLPELARGIGKFMREFRRQTDEVRTVVEREFYKMDQELDPLPMLTPPEGTRPAPSLDPAPGASGSEASPTPPPEGGAAAAPETGPASALPPASVTPEGEPPVPEPKPSGGQPS